MGFFVQLIGLFLIIAGGLSIVTRIPNIVVSQYADTIDPLIRLGITNPSLFLVSENKENTLFFDIILIFIIVLIGVIMLTKGGKKTSTNPLKK
jgi:hypothetical protein